MSTSSPGSRSAASAATISSPIPLATKSTAAAPRLNNEMELGSLAAIEGQAESVPSSNTAVVAVEHQNDIMQLARIGDISSMEKLFESGEFDATYSDEEGITPLHVRSRSPQSIGRSQDVGFGRVPDILTLW